jgi:hypothetical protein
LTNIPSSGKIQISGGNLEVYGYGNNLSENLIIWTELKFPEARAFFGHRQGNFFLGFFKNADICVF